MKYDTSLCTSSVCAWAVNPRCHIGGSTFPHIEQLFAGRRESCCPGETPRCFQGISFVLSDVPPPRVSSVELFWSDPPPAPSPRCLWWCLRIHRGWRPNKRLRGKGYYELAEFYGVWIYDYIHVIYPLIKSMRVFDEAKLGEVTLTHTGTKMVKGRKMWTFKADVKKIP